MHTQAGIRSVTYSGRTAMAADKARELMGYCYDAAEAEAAGVTEPLFIHPADGRPVYTLRNRRNRPFALSWSQTLGQEHLRRRWQFNGEVIIIADDGEVLSGQHRLVSVDLAEAERTGPHAEHWAEFWRGPITMETVVVYGVPNRDDVVNTIDTGRPRSLADVVYRSDLFEGLSSADRRTSARVLEAAVGAMWTRTGANVTDRFVRTRTHAESLDFIARHPRLLQSVRHVVEHYRTAWRANRERLPPGWASAMLYLMGCGASDGDRYRAAHPPSERHLDWSLWPVARNFWELMATSDPELAEVRHALARFVDPETDSGGPTLAERLGTIIKAWGTWSAGRRLTTGCLKLKYLPSQDEDGRPVLDETPTCGGIDLGDPEDAALGDEEDEPAPPKRPTRAAPAKKALEPRVAPMTVEGDDDGQHWAEVGRHDDAEAEDDEDDDDDPDDPVDDPDAPFKLDPQELARRMAAERERRAQEEAAAETKRTEAKRTRPADGDDDLTKAAERAASQAVRPPQQRSADVPPPVPMGRRTTGRRL